MVRVIESGYSKGGICHTSVVNTLLAAQVRNPELDFM